MGLKTAKTEKKLRKEILRKVSEYHGLFHKKKDFEPGKSFVAYGGRVYDGKELCNLVGSALDFWLTSGPYVDAFEKKFGEVLGVRHVSLVNSGSSANLLAFMALTSPKLGERRIKPGDEVITVAAGFPTTVTPIIQYGAVPVFVDVEIPSYNIDCSLLEKALSKKTKAVMVAHTLGNPFDLKKVRAFCDKHRLWLIEDNCDALGSRYRRMEDWKTGGLAKPADLCRCQSSNPTTLQKSALLPILQSSNPLIFQYTGTFGDIGTSSFYPPHHMTMGEGGAVYTDNPQLKRLVDSELRTVQDKEQRLNEYMPDFMALFSSSSKYDAGNGWPFFREPIVQKHVWIKEDLSLPFRRYEVLCRACDSHLGHVFREKSGLLRYTINSIALQFRDD